jgi:hypothetical protein
MGMTPTLTSVNTSDWWKTGSPSLSSSSSSTSTPAYDRVSSIPDWLPKEGNGELLDQYNQVASQFDPKAFDEASQGQESRILTTGLNAGANAAADYANRARQAGGSGMGAGLIKAEASVGARKTAGDIALDRERFNAGQREKAATLSTQIATTLGNLRQSYLNTIVDYATREDATSAEYKSKMAAVDATNAGTAEQAREFNWKQPLGGQYQTDTFGNITNLAGTPFRDPTTGLPSSNVAFAPTNRRMNASGGIFG